MIQVCQLANTNQGWSGDSRKHDVRSTAGFLRGWAGDFGKVESSELAERFNSFGGCLSVERGKVFDVWSGAESPARRGMQRSGKRRSLCEAGGWKMVQSVLTSESATAQHQTVSPVRPRPTSPA